MFTQSISITALVLAAALFVLALAPVSKADSVTYTFTGINNSLNNDQLSVAFTYTAPGFIPPTPVGEVISLFASQLDSCTNCLVSSTVPAVFLSSWGVLVSTMSSTTARHMFFQRAPSTLPAHTIPALRTARARLSLGRWSPLQSPPLLLSYSSDSSFSPSSPFANANSSLPYPLRFATIL